MENFDDLSEEEIQQLIQLGIIPEQQGILAQQIAQANALRNSPGPEMRGNGRIQTAANPLEFLAKGMQEYKTTKELKELRKQQQDALQEQVRGRRTFLSALNRNRSAPSMYSENAPVDNGF